MNWHKDDREGRFLLRRIDEVSQIGAMMTTAAAAGDGSAAATSSQSSKDGDFKRKLSKREKKAIKKQEKLNKANKDKDGGSTKDGESSVAEKLYTGKSKFSWNILF